jgi:quercetin dioxygenase-like cupin family protein
MFRYFVDKKDCNYRLLFPGVHAWSMRGQAMSMTLVEFEPHAVVEEHSHPHEQMGLMLEGEAQFFIGDESRLIRAGEMWRIPGGVKHKVIAGDLPVKALDIFHPVREEYV